ncbi:hypothetical protein ACQR1N_08395 [Bradyrhizobium sp. HKCCYLRH1073]|uniref:hypothetical protein n=1 Tax=unclassified Bradyrhizobium TaxID=2631580 RepID=UPI0028EA10B1|nr:MULTISPECIES: hypothetical protein [unclassified Bradyrhizobium]
MIGQLSALPVLTSSRLGAAAALVSVICIAAPGAAQAGPANGDMVNGQYCNDLCKAYMAWSDRMLAVTQPASYSRPQVRVAVPQSMTPKKMDKAEKPDRMAQHGPKPHRPANLNSFAQLPSGTQAAQSSMEPPPSDLAASDAPATGRLFAADPLPHSAIADMRRATDAAGLRLVSMTEPGMTPVTVGEAGGSPRSKMPSMWIMLAAAALLAYFGHGWLKRRNGTSHHLN